MCNNNDVSLTVVILYPAMQAISRCKKSNVLWPRLINIGWCGEFFTQIWPFGCGGRGHVNYNIVSIVSFTHLSCFLVYEGIISVIITEFVVKSMFIVVFLNHDRLSIAFQVFIILLILYCYQKEYCGILERVFWKEYSRKSNSQLMKLE